MSKLYSIITPAEICWQEDMPRSVHYNDIYHSSDGAIAESDYVFIEGNALPKRWQELKPKDSFVIAETGFGAGLNFLVTAQHWQQQHHDATLIYYAIEKHPLRKDALAALLKRFPQLAYWSTQLLSQYPPLTPGFHSLTLSHGVRLVLIFADVLDGLHAMQNLGERPNEPFTQLPVVHCWYLDGFAPAKNPEMWQPAVFQAMALVSKPNATVSTYTCARMVKDGLVKAGFEIEKRAGFAHKKHHLTAQLKTPVAARRLGSCWYIGQQDAHICNTAIILGAGLAGCVMANRLANHGFTVSLIDEHAQIAQGASGNPYALLFAQFSAYSSPLSQFLLQAYAHAVAYYQPFKHQSYANFSGMACLVEAESATYRQWIQSLSPLVEWLSASELSAKLGVSIDKSGLWLPDSGWVNMSALCQTLIAHPTIRFYGSTRVDAIRRHDSQWLCADHRADLLILASGWGMRQFKQASFLPLRPIKGQLTAVPATSNSQSLRACISSANGHLLPAIQGVHWLGATYHIGQTDTECHQIDDETNLAAIAALPITLPSESCASWAAVRACSNDYAPMIGQLPIEADFLENFAFLQKDAKKQIKNHSPFYPNLYCLTGFGSKGLSTIPLATEVLLAKILNQPLPIPQQVVNAIAPARFLVRRHVNRLSAER